MLKQRIISTLKFFDIQDLPLTLFELHKFLLVDLEELKQSLEEKWELKKNLALTAASVTVGEVLKCLEEECQNEIERHNGYYCLLGRKQIINQRLQNYFFGIKREKLIRRFIGGARFLPFMRGLGLVGSQALGQQKPDSDIDLLILTSPKYLWLARFFVTAYFQVLGRRRHGKKIASRFCLNHYVAQDKELDFDRNLYTAAEYLKVRPLVIGCNIISFQNRNQSWVKAVFPNTEFVLNQNEKPSGFKKALEYLFMNSFGRALEKISKKIQYRRLKLGEFIVASDDELSFHPHNRKKELFRRFFELQEQDQGKAVELVSEVKV